MKGWKLLSAAVIFLLVAYFAFYASAIAADGYEDDDAFQNSTSVPANASVQYHTIHESGDMDWINFSAISGSMYVIETFNLTASTAIDTHIALYDTDGTTRLDYNDDIIFGKVRRSRIIWNSTSTGTFFVNISELYNYSGGNYNIRVMRVGSLVANITYPFSNTNVSEGKSFTVNATLACVDGVCLNVTAYLDPKEKSDKLKEVLDSEGKVNVIIEYKQPELRGAFSKESKKASAGNRIVSSLSGNKGFKLKRELNEKMLAAEVDASSLEYIRSLPDVKAVYYDRPVQAFLDSSIPHINGYRTQAIQVNGVNITGAGQTVCVLDTGINYSHADFGGCSRTSNISDGSCAVVVGGYDYVNDDADPYDDNGHGSHVSGIIASQDSTYKGIAPGARIVSMKVLNAAGGGSASDIISAVQWCVNRRDVFNISMISMSLGSLNSKFNYHCNDLNDAPERTAIEDAVSKNISVFISAGNEDYTDGISTPACIESAISVGNANDADTLTDNRGVILDLIAPGVGITATDYDGTHVSFGGTSMSAPHASGLAALIQQYSLLRANRSLNSTELKHKMRFNGFNIYDSGNYMTFPRIDAYASTMAKGIIPTTINAEPFYTTSPNPVNDSCLEWMTNGSTCNQSWLVYATGTPNTTWEFFSAYETDYRFNRSNRFNMTILNATLISLNEPSNASYISNSSIVLNCSATSDFNLTNITLYHNMSQWHANSTVNLSGLQNSSAWQLNFSEGEYLWGCQVCNTADCFFSSNYTFTVDTIYPVFEDVNYTYLISLGNIENITANVTGLHLSYVNLSINQTNYTMTLNGSMANYTYLPYYNRTYNFTLYAMDLAGNLNQSTESFIVNDTTPAPLYYSVTPSNSTIRYNWSETLSVIALDGYPITVFLDHNGTNVTMPSSHYYNFSYSWNISQCASSITYKLHANNSINQSNYTTGTLTVTGCCGNSVCESGESCGSCSGDCGQCTASSSSSGGGGGGGSSSEPPASQNFIFSSLKKGEKVEVKPTSSLIPVTSVAFTSSGSDQRTVLTVAAVEDSGVEPPKNTYQLLKIELSSGKASSAKINFKVPISWFKNNSAAKEDLVMKRLKGEWEELKTDFAGKQNNSYLFTAESPGFSYFAISLKQKQEEAKPEEVKEEGKAAAEEEMNELQPLEEKREDNNETKKGYRLVVLAISIIIIWIIILEIVELKKELKKPKKTPKKVAAKFRKAPSNALRP
ncbi:MAG: S8 family serine peptidase [Candidatus Woesearchaeota archaeon]